MAKDTTSKISENPKKKKQIWCSDEGKQFKKETDREWGHCLDLWEVWSHSYHLPPQGAAKENETDLWDYHLKYIFLIILTYFYWSEIFNAGLTCNRVFLLYGIST